MTSLSEARSAAGVCFASTLASHGGRIALITDDIELSYVDLAQRVLEVGERLGSTRRLVLIGCANEIDPIVTYLGALAYGHPVLLVPACTGSAAEALIAAYDPDAIVSRDAGLWNLEERREGSAHDLHPDLALLLCTSGSTGSPKLARLSHDNVQANADAIADYLDIRTTDRAAMTLPMHYCYGLSVINSHLSRGAGLVLTDLSVVDTCFWDLFTANRCTSLAGVPYTFDLLDRVGFGDMALPHLRYVTQAGGRLAPDRVRGYAELGQRNGWDFFVMYGQTEATARMAYLPPELTAEHPEAIGIPIPGGSFALGPSAGSDDDTGELVYSGPNVMLGYAQTPADLALGRTVKALHTGDIARRTADGLYVVVGRRSRFTKILGLRIDLQQAETVFADRGISVACVGVDDELVVVHDNGYDPQVLRRLASTEFGLPATTIRICHLPELPRLASGKPDYPALVDQTRSSQPSPVSAAPPSADAEALRTLFAELLDRPSATLDSTFVGLGGDSLSYVEMSVRLEKAIGHLPADWHATPIRDLTPNAPRRKRRGNVIETSVVLRAIGIILIVGTHVKLFNILGSAHVLVAIAGFNFARFQLTSVPRRERFRGQLRTVLRIALPSMAWIFVVMVATDHYHKTTVLLLNSVVGTTYWNYQWHFWFIEVLIYILVGLAAILAIPWMDRAERRFPFGFAAALVGVALLTRFELVEFAIPHTKPLLWLFAIGWATARANTTWRRLLVMAAIVVTVPNFYGNPMRELVIFAGLTLLLWVPGMRCPAIVSHVVSFLAAASLYIYLTHWQVILHLIPHQPALAVIAALIVGIAYWRLSTAAMRMTGPRRVVHSL